MKIFMKILFLAAALPLLSGCEAMFSTMEFGGIVSPELNIVQYRDGYALKISGRCGKSGYVVEKIKQIKSGGELQVLVLTSPLERDSRPVRFETEVILDDDIDLVTFGEQREVLWRRRPPEPDERPRQQFRPPEP